MKQSLIWDYYQNERPETFLGAWARLEFLAKQISPPGKVLNVGIGGGIFEDIAIKRNLEVSSVDPDAGTVERLRHRLEVGKRAKVGSIENLPFPDNVFDAVVVSEVLEHLSDESLENGLSEIARVLRRGGRIIGTVPARENLDEQFAVCPECGKQFHRWGHVQSFTITRLTRILGQKFVVQKVVERPFVTLRQLNLKGRIVGVVKLALWALGMHGGGESIVFIALQGDQ
jgi:SAM-dependent methyltransferase